MNNRYKLVVLSTVCALIATNPANAQREGGTLIVGMDRPMTGFDSSMNPPIRTIVFNILSLVQ